MRINSIYENILKDVAKSSKKSNFKNEFKKFLLSERSSDELCEEMNNTMTKIESIIQTSSLETVKIEDFAYQFEILRNIMMHIQDNHNPGVININEKMNTLKINCISNDFIISELLKYFKELQ